MPELRVATTTTTGMNVYYVAIRGRRLLRDYQTLSGALAGLRCFARENRVNGRALKHLIVRFGQRDPAAAMWKDTHERGDR